MTALGRVAVDISAVCMIPGPWGSGRVAVDMSKARLKRGLAVGTYKRSRRCGPHRD